MIICSTFIGSFLTLKRFSSFVLLALLLLSSFSVYAQANLVISSVPSTVRLHENSVQYSVSNRGSAVSERFRIRVWASIDNDIDASDLVSTSDVFQPLPPRVGSNNPSENHRINFRFPLPPEFTQSPFSRLTGDTLSPSQWIGTNMFARACILNEAGTTEIRCSSAVDAANPVAVLPPILGPNGFTYAPMGTSTGISSEFIELTWPVVPDDNGSPLIDEYRFTEIDSNGNENPIVVSINELETFTDATGVEMFRMRLEGREPGTRYSYANDQFVCLNNVCAFTTGVGGGTNDFVGNTFAIVPASTDLDGKVVVNWNPYAPVVGGYNLSRCNGNDLSQCVRLATLLQTTSYEDNSVVRGEEYTYLVDVCDRVSPNNFRRCQTGTGRFFRVGVSNLGRSSLVDQFEDDDTAGQATVVSSSVRQVHSFDSPTDDDWVQVNLSKASRLRVKTSAFDNENADTVLSVFDSSLNLLFENDDSDPVSNPSGFSEIETTLLPQGRYFVKATHFKLPIDGFPAPVIENYVLEIEILDLKVNMAPIIQLLLED